MLRFSNEWLRRKIASDPDVETEAGPPLFGSRRFGPDPENREPEPGWQIPPIETRPRQPFFTIRRNPMSYSFGITATSKADATAKVVAEFDQVVANQPPQAADKEAVVAAASAFIGILREPGDGEQLSVNVYGSLGWEGDYSAPTAFRSGNVSVSAFIAAKS
jgi:NAD-dependent oxidoreductase involved in siderophore biosynthesis